jgi:hypothetical protein
MVARQEGGDDQGRMESLARIGKATKPISST